MAKAKLTPEQAAFLKARQEQDVKAIADHSAATEALALARARRDQVVAEHDKLVAESESRLADATRVLIARLGPEGAVALGVEVPQKSRQVRIPHSTAYREEV